VVVRGSAPLLLVAPHGGRRDAARRPWGSAPLKMNDLHTGSLARELAERLGAGALINDGGDRNDVDLNRLSAAHDAAPHFLEALGDLVEEALARHPRLCLLTVHGWNVVQPAVDIGLGAAPGAAVRGGGTSAISEAFASTVLPRFAARLTGCGIAATPGLRYPARAKENLLQVFTTRYRDDGRPAVARLARLADRVDALQLELSLPLRLPGPWRDAFVTACTAALAPADGLPASAWNTDAEAGADVGADAIEPIALEFVAPGLSGLAALDPQGGRLLLFTDDHRLFTFTGERVGAHGTDRVAGLRIATAPSGEVDLGYDGPMLAFPDTMPFVDLERGLASAAGIAAEVHLRWTAAHLSPDAPCPFGALRGHARIGATRYEIAGHAVRTRREIGLAARSRAALRLADGSVVVARSAGGIVCRAGRHVAVTGCRVDDDGALARLDLTTEDGERLTIGAAISHRLPVVPGVPGAPPLVFASCRHDGRLAGWVTLRSG
jgi:hypothetical protein